MNIGFNFEASSALAPNKGYLAFSGLKPSIDSVAVKVLEGSFCSKRLLGYAESLLSVASFIWELSWTYWETCCSFYSSTWSCTLRFNCRDDFFPLDIMNTSQPAQN